ncbi:MAG: S53 family peptidase [Pirellulales bacterium]
MRTVRAAARSTLRFEHLEERLPMSADLGTLWPASLPSLEALKKKPAGSPYPIGLTPDQVRTAYGFDEVSFGGIVGDGSGQTIAIVAAHHSPTIVNDLKVFDQTFGLPDPPSFTIFNQKGGAKPASKNRGWAAEIALDVEWAHAIAPGANIVLVEAKNEKNFGYAVDLARHIPGVSVISVSAAGDEFDSEADADPLFTTPYGHTGETFVFAAGDEGAVAEYPSSSPNVLSVGGTSLYLDNNNEWYTEYAWSDGGGGASKYEGVPSYQSGLGLTTRGTPDVAYAGDPYTGFAVFDTYGSGGWAQFGGTSAGTPQWAALLAIANQGRALAGKNTLANAQAVLYSMPSTDFHDIIYGNNGASAGYGYDLATGRGSPIADRLIPDLVAYNGSTNFTVTTLFTPPTSKSHKRLQLGNPNSVMLQAPTNEVSSGKLAAKAAGRLRLAGSHILFRQTAAPTLDVDTNQLAGLAATQLRSSNAAEEVAATHVRQRANSAAAIGDSSANDRLALVTSVDAYFSQVGVAA